MNPDYADGYYDRGNTQFYLGNYDLAVTDYSKAIALEDEIFDYYYNRALAKFYLEQDEDACSDLKKASKLGDNQAAAYYDELCR